MFELRLYTKSLPDSISITRLNNIIKYFLVGWWMIERAVLAIRYVYPITSLTSLIQKLK